jgi:hypothetical protein
LVDILEWDKVVEEDNNMSYVGCLVLDVKLTLSISKGLMKKEVGWK